MQDIWVNIYSYVIPTLFLALYIALEFCCGKGVFQKNIADSENIGNMLNGTITFVTIIMSIFGFLIPALVSNKRDCGMVEFFLARADRKFFVARLKALVMSGMMTVLLCLLLFLNDVLGKKLFVLGIGLLIWFLLYFVCNAYRFIGLILSLLIYDRKGGGAGAANAAGKEVKDAMSDEEADKLNELLKEKKNGGSY